MGKLSIKQKAERYDKIIEIAKSKILYPDKACYVNINEIFPELVKSEDEQIKERLIGYFSDFRLGTFAGIDPKKIIDWLEKQREPIDKEKVQIGARKDIALSIMNFLDKNTRSTCLSSMECADLEDAVVDSDWSKVYDYMKKKLENQDEPTLKTTEVKPKFKVGDWIVFNGLILYVDKVVQGYYRTISIDGILNSYDWDIDNAARLWTIQDAKDGDVLASKDKDKVFLYNGKLDLRGRVCAYCGIYRTHDGLRFTECAIGNYFTYKEPHPATKEQRDLLFVKMYAEGYEWDAEKKELKIALKEMQESIDDAPFEQESTEWSEEGEKIRNWLIGYFHQYKKDGIEKYANGLKVESIIDWLKSPNPQSQWVPTKEQMRALSIAIRCGIQLGSEEEKALRSLRKQLLELKKQEKLLLFLHALFTI